MQSNRIDDRLPSLHCAMIEANPTDDVNDAADTFLGKQLNRGIVQSHRIGTV